MANSSTGTCAAYSAYERPHFISNSMTTAKGSVASEIGTGAADTRPLFTAYPALKSMLPFVAYADLPTPVEAMAGLTEQSGTDDVSRAWIKRDDLTHADYAGNKVRKLEFVRGEIRQRGARHVYTFGATGTNAGLATARMCAYEGIACTVFLFDQPASATVERHYRALQHSGARLVHCGSLLRAVLAFYLHPARLSSKSYFLYAGCANPVATFGYVNAAFELAEQIQQGQCPEPDRIFVAASSSSTLAGLNLGCHLAGLKTRVIGVRVAPAKLGPFDACSAAVAQKQQDAAWAFLQRSVTGLPAISPPAVVMRDEWYGAGYGEPTNAGQAALQVFKERGYTLEATYTAKAAAAFLDALKNSNDTLLFWNTYNSRPLPA